MIFLVAIEAVYAFKASKRHFWSTFPPQTILLITLEHKLYNVDTANTEENDERSPFSINRPILSLARRHNFIIGDRQNTLLEALLPTQCNSRKIAWHAHGAVKHHGRCKTWLYFFEQTVKSVKSSPTRLPLGDGATENWVSFTLFIKISAMTHTHQTPDAELLLLRFSTLLHSNNKKLSSLKEPPADCVKTMVSVFSRKAGRADTV